jgi:diguanylate cyclase (GGDEF)-like protein
MTRRRPADTPRSARLEERRGGLPAGLGAVSLLIAEFEDWSCQWRDDAGRWTAFDRFVREQLYSVLGANRVRCYRLVAQDAALESLSPSREPFAASVSARDGVYGYVISRGYRYIRHDELLGPAVHQLADQAPDPPIWCFPITYDRSVHGLIIVGTLKPEAAADIGLLESLGGVISLLWHRLADHERIVLTGHTDQGSGVLSRVQFFEQAERALADGFANHEPSLAVALTLEGIRRLDDAGLWEPRDRAITAAGQALRSKLRSDDVVGRFADDRFVALMRRLDTSLGRMIAQKLLEAVQESLSEADPRLCDVVVRCGLAGPGRQQPTLQELLSKAFHAVFQARLAGLNMWDDLDEERESAT